MKQITLTDEQYNFLRSLSDKIKDENVKLQPKHITANPCFCVYQKEYEYADTGWHFEEGWSDADGLWVSDNEVFGYIKDQLKDGLETPNRKFDDIMMELGFSRYSRKERLAFVGAYLTHEAAQKHIEQNSYHYNEPLIFVNSFWRNPEMENLRNLLMSLEFETKDVQLAEAV